MRILTLAGLVLGVAYIYDPEATRAFLHSVARGLEWGIGREIAHGLFSHRFN